MTLFLTLIASGALCAPASGGDAGPYEVADLGILPHPGIQFMVPFDLNNHGEAVGYMQRGAPPYTLYAWLWRPGEGLTELPPPAPYNRNVATSITDSGIIAGRADFGLSGETSSVGWIWEDGEYTLLPPFPDDCTGVVPAAVNENREVVGKTCQGGPSYHAFYWSEATGYIDLNTFGIDLVHDINNDGVVSGGTFDGAVRWTLEKGIESIGTLAAPHDDSGYGRAINQFGEVAGISVHALTGPDGYRAFFYSDATGMLSIAPTIFLRSIGQGINDQGDVVGTEGNDSAQHNNPWVWMRATGERFFLNDIVSSADFAAFDYAIDINNRGQILLRGSTSAPGPDHPVILTPIITGDLDGDGAVGFSDLLILLAAWGECPAPPADCPADLDASGDVGFSDLLILLTNWTG